MPSISDIYSGVQELMHQTSHSMTHGSAKTATRVIDCHLKLDGVPGESKHKNHKDEIPLRTWHWDIQNPSSSTTGGQSVGKGYPGMLTISKSFDSSSPTIAKFCANGKHFKEATLSMAKSGDGQSTFLTVKLKEVFISSYDVGAEHSGDLHEHLSVSYGDIEFGYKPQKPDGSLGGEVKFGWDVRTTETR